MNAEGLFIYGAIAGVLSVFAYLPYTVDTLKGCTQPQRSSWMIWSLLASISFFSQMVEGATDSLWFAGVQTSGTIVVFLLSIRFGVGSFCNRADSVILAGAVFGILLWYATDSAVYALAISIGIGALGGSLTVIKAYRDPGSESILSWLVSFVATAFALMSIGGFDAVMMAYPLYLFVLYASIIVAMLLGRMLQPVREFDETAPVLSVGGYRPLLNNSVGQGLHYDLEKLNDDNVYALVSGLRKRGVGDRVINAALHDVVHG